jgi:hypothetical protein
MLFIKLYRKLKFLYLGELRGGIGMKLPIFGRIFSINICYFGLCNKFIVNEAEPEGNI